MKLGVIVSNIRNNVTYKQHREVLVEMGLDFSKSMTCKSYPWDFIKGALERYKELHGHLRVPVSFIIPKDTSDWPKSHGGMKLGSIVSDIRNNVTYKQHREELVEMGLDFSKSMTCKPYP